MAAVREARATWRGDLFTGSGEVTGRSSGQLSTMPVTWASRTADPQGRTSPEELLAAAHAACFSMAFSNNLAKAGSPAERLDVTVAVSFEKQEAGWRVTRSQITVRGSVPGMDQSSFREQAEAAKDNCPISQALRNNVQMTVDASLEGGS